MPMSEIPEAAGMSAPLRIGVHADSVALLTLSRLGWLDEALFAEGVLVEWVACEDGVRTAALIAAGKIDLGAATAADLRARARGVVVVDSLAHEQIALVVDRAVAERRSRLVATVLQALEQAETWSRAHPAAASTLLARAYQYVAGLPGRPQAAPDLAGGATGTSGGDADA